MPEGEDLLICSIISVHSMLSWLGVQDNILTTITSNICITIKIFKTGDQESYKMELLEEDKSSELQERFLQVTFLRYVPKKETTFDTVVFSTTIC